VTHELASRWRAAVQTVLPMAVELRHELHAAPSLGGQEAPTARTVVDWMGVGDGSVVAGTGRLLRLPGGEGAGIAVRAELDGLPVAETSAVPWASRNGAMHACGHDVHLAGVAAVVRAAATIELPRPLVALLQPREEGVDSGAKDVVDEGGLDGIEAVVAAHTVAGDADAIVRVRLEGIEALERVIEQLRRDPKIMRTRTMVALSTLVERP